MIKKILLYMVFAIPSVFLGFFSHFYNGADVLSSIVGALIFLVMTHLVLAWATGDLRSKEEQSTYNLPKDESQSIKIINKQRISKRIDGYKITYQGTDEELAKLQHSMLKSPFYVFDSWLWSVTDGKPTLTVTYYEKTI